MNSLEMIDTRRKDFVMICEIDSICTVLSDEVICGVLERMKVANKKKKVRFNNESKEYDGLHPYNAKYLEVMTKYFNGEIKEKKDVLCLKDLDFNKIHFICIELQGVFHRLQKKRSCMILPNGGSHLKLLESHSTAVVSLYRILYNTLNELIYS